MAHSRVPTRHPVDRTGFTLVELLLSLVMGMIVVGASLSFAVATFRGAGGNRLREEVYRNARFIGGVPGARITARNDVSSTRTARSAALAVLPYLMLPC